jgi:hypothetical protein
MRFQTLLVAALLTACTSTVGTTPGGGGGPSPAPVAMPASAPSRAEVEAKIRQEWADSTITSLHVEATTVQAARAKQPVSVTSLPSDAPVWLAVIEGDLKGPIISPVAPGQVSPVNEGASQVAMILPPEGWPPLAFTSTAKEQPPAYTILPRTQEVWYVGDTWGFVTTGEPIEGQLQLTIRNRDTGEERSYTVTFQDAPTFQLPLDAAHLPGFKDAPLQTFDVLIKAPLMQLQSVITVLRDRP